MSMSTFIPFETTTARGAHSTGYILHGEKQKHWDGMFSVIACTNDENMLSLHALADLLAIVSCGATVPQLLGLRTVQCDHD
jgi:hypothetical protein